MMGAILRNYDIVSGASIDGVYLEVPVRAAALERKLKQLGPFLLAPRGRGAGRSACLILELWRIVQGRLMPAGVDHRALSTTWADALDGLARHFIGDGKKLWGPLTRSLNDVFCVAPYYELVIGVPDVRFGSSDPSLYTLVLGMVTDSRLARSLDWWSGYGYQKQLGGFSFGEAGEFQIDVDSGPFLRGAVKRARDAATDFSWLDARWRQPLLGCVGNDSFSVSRLQRAITREARCHAATGWVELGAAASELSLPHLDGSRAGRAGSGRVALYSGVTTRISTPRRFEPK